MAEPMDRYYQLILEKIAEDKYPSGELMDRLEAGITNPQQLQEYLDVLLDKVEKDHYPSKQMLDRVRRLAELHALV